MEFSLTSPALPHFTEAAGVVVALQVTGGKAGRVEAATGARIVPVLLQHQVQQTQAAVEEVAPERR